MRRSTWDSRQILMARITLDALKKREVLYGGKTPPEQLAQMAREYLAAGYPGDAVLFFAQADDREGLQQVKETALEDGDAFVLSACARASEELVTDADWRALSERARELGKDAHAERAAHILAGGDPMGPIEPAEEDE